MMCLTVGLTALIYLIMWPGMLINFFGIHSYYFTGAVFGMVINLIILFLVGLLIDKKSKYHPQIPFRYLTIIVFLLLLVVTALLSGFGQCRGGI